MLGVGIIGAGFIAQAHVAAYAALGVRVVGVMSRSRSSAERLAGPGVIATDDLARLLAEPEIEAVDICSPTHTHASIGIAAARAGKHVHVEKPMALSLADADALIDACEHSRVKLMVGQTARFTAVSRALHDAVTGDALGTPFHLDLCWDHGAFWPGGWRGWHFDPEQSGGHLVHNGVHAFDLACWLLGQAPKSVYAQARAVAHAAMRTHDFWQAQLIFDGGATATCEIGYILRQSGAVHRTATLYGTQGTAMHDTGDDGLLVADDGPRPLGLTGRDPMQVQLGAWLECLRDASSPPPVAGADGRRALAISLAAARSVASGQPEPIAA